MVVLSVDSSNLKELLRSARISLAFCNYTECYSCLKVASDLYPNSPQVKHQIMIYKKN